MARNFVAASSQFLEKTSAVLTAVPLSMACWYRPVATNVLYNLMCLGVVSNPNNFFALRHRATNVVNATTDTAGTGVNAATSTGATAGTWAHACGVWASVTSRAAYINGGSKGTNAVSSTPVGINGTLIGALYSGPKTNFTDGDIAEAAIWNIDLSDADALSLSKGVSPACVRPEALVAYWPLIGKFSPELDYWRRNELTVSGATQVAHPRIYNKYLRQFFALRTPIKRPAFRTNYRPFPFKPGGIY